MGKGFLEPNPMVEFMKAVRYAAFAILLIMLLSGLQLLETAGNEPAHEIARGLQSSSTRNSVPNMDENISYAIITDYKFIPYLEPLRDMKTQKGVKAQIYDLNDTKTGILENYKTRGIDNAQKIHEFLRDLDSLNPNLEWVLLVGDHEIIPSRKLFLNGSISTNYADVDGCGYKQYTYSDYYYAGLDSTWNSNPDQLPIIWGEEGETDWTPNVYVGRLPVSDPMEAKRAVQNILDYELDPPPGYWYNSFLTYAGLMDTPNILSYPPNQNLAYQSYKDNAYEVALKIQKYIPEEMTNYLLYDYNKIEGGDYSPFYDTLNHSNAQHYWNLGNSMVAFASHGYSDGDAFLEYQGDGDMFYHSQSFPFFDYEDAYNTKNGGMLPLVYGSACGVGNFTEGDDTNMERLLYAPDGGAIGLIVGSSESTYRCEFEENDSSYGNWWLMEEFFRLLLEEEYFRPGRALYESKVNYGERIKDPQNPHKEYPYKTLYKTNRVAYNLMGDPEIPIWTDAPGELSVEYPLPLHINNRSLEVTVRDPLGQPVEGATICLYAGDIYQIALTHPNGSATFDLELNHTITLNLTVTAHNYFRWTGQVEVVSVLDLMCVKSTFGRSVEYPVAGELIDIFVNVSNQGTVPVNGVVVNFYLNSIDPSNILRSLTKQNLASGESRRYSATWKVEASSTHTLVLVSIDPENTIYEYNEDNNVGSIQIRDNKPVKWLKSPWVNMSEDSELMDHPDRFINMYEFGFDDDSFPRPISFAIESVSTPDCNCSLIEISENEIYLNVVPKKDWTGTVKILISLTDGATSAVTDVTVLVEDVPDPPSFPDIPPLESRESTWFEARIYATDIDSDLLNFTCSCETLNVTCVQETNTSINISFWSNNTQVGEHVITLTATDPSGLGVQIEVPVTIMNENSPPTIIEPSTGWEQKINVDREFLLYIKAEDEDKGDTLTFSDDTDMFEINATSGAIRFKPTTGDVGVHEIWITVSDANGTRDTINITLDITHETFQGNSYSVIVIFIICVVLIVALTLFLGSKKKEDQRQSGEDGEDQGLRNEPMSIKEWAFRDSDLEDIIDEYSGEKLRARGKRKKLKRTTKKALPPTERIKKKRGRT